jgi:hypothetical protein
MTTLADPHLCPSCRTSLPAHLVCPGCGLDLRGDPGAQLFALLTSADDLIARMRADAVATAPVSVAAPATAAGTPLAPMAPAAPQTSGGLGLATVPAVLLGLGALCVIAAASLFLPFAWGLLGVVGRTVVLIALTVAAAAGARAAGGRGLRATSEALGAVALGLLTFDVLGARSSGWFGDITEAPFLVLLGSVLVVAGTATTLWLRRTEAGAFVTGEVTAVLGSVTLAVGGTSLEVGDLDDRLAALVPLLSGLALASAALRLQRRGVDSMATAAVGHGTLAVVLWAGLLMAGLARLEDGLSWSALWPGGAGLTLVLAGAYAAAPALTGSLEPATRAGFLSVGLVPWAVALTAPAYDEGATGRCLVVLAPLVLAVLAVQLLPRDWAVAALPTGALSAAGASILVAPIALAAVAACAETVSPAWEGSPGGRAVPANDAASLRSLSGVATGDLASLGSPWLLPVVVATLVLSVPVLVRRLGDEAAAAHSRTLLAVGGVVVLLALSGALLLEAVPVWSVLALLLAGTVAATVLALRTPLPEWHGASVALAAAALVLSLHDEWLTLATCLLLMALAATQHVRGAPEVRGVGGGAAVLLLGGAMATVAALAEAPAEWSALVVMLVMGALVLGRGRLGGRTGMLGVEIGCIAVACAATALGVGLGQGRPATWLAVYLTVAGAVTTLVSLTRPDRRAAGWAGGVLLASATWVRLAELGVQTPEAYTLPSAVALLVAGWYRTRHDAGTSTLTAWSPGLGLALVPSLLWSLDDPLSWRALTLGVACLALTIVGAQLRWAAPFVWGAGVGAVLVLWEVVPPTFEASSWLVMGVAGACLLVLGASWEQRVQDARAALGYLRALR